MPRGLPMPHANHDWSARSVPCRRRQTRPGHPVISDEDTRTTPSAAISMPAPTQEPGVGLLARAPGARRPRQAARTGRSGMDGRCHRVPSPRRSAPPSERRWVRGQVDPDALALRAEITRNRPPLDRHWTVQFGLMTRVSPRVVADPPVDGRRRGGPALAGPRLLVPASAWRAGPGLSPVSQPALHSGSRST